MPRPPQGAAHVREQRYIRSATLRVKDPARNAQPVEPLRLMPSCAPP